MHSYKVPRSTCSSWLLSYNPLLFSLNFSLRTGSGGGQGGRPNRGPNSRGPT